MRGYCRRCLSRYWRDGGPSFCRGRCYRRRQPKSAKAKAKYRRGQRYTQICYDEIGAYAAIGEGETEDMNDEPQIIQSKPLSLQICAPAAFTDAQIADFANRTQPAGTENGWSARCEGEGAARVDCSERAGCVHVIVDC